MILSATTTDQARQQRGIAAAKRAVSEHTGVSIFDITGKRRLTKIVQARQLATYLARLTTGASYPDLAAAFGQADHMAALYSCRVLEQRRKDPDFDTDVRLLLGHLTGEIKPSA
jgi:chromosomal replication initiation ATPase DnaA